jgi:hypothetical protein
VRIHGSGWLVSLHPIKSSLLTPLKSGLAVRLDSLHSCCLMTRGECKAVRLTLGTLQACSLVAEGDEPRRKSTLIMSDPTSSTSTSNPSSSSTSSSSSASSSSSSSPPPSTSASSSSSSPSASKPPHYTLQPQSPHTDPSYRPSPLEPVQLPPPAPCLREPPSSDLIPASRPTLTQFRASEGPATRSAKLHALWEDLPKLPELGDGPTALQRMKLPGQDTTTALSPERAERLRKLYEEELVRRVKEKRPEARLWGGADDQPHFKSTQEKGIAFEDFRWVRVNECLWLQSVGLSVSPWFPRLPLA